jgi:hypothetical protein
VEAHVAEFRLAEAEVAQIDGKIPVRVQLREEPGAFPSGVKILTTGSKLMGRCSWSRAARTVSQVQQKQGEHALPFPFLCARIARTP